MTDSSRTPLPLAYSEENEAIQGLFDGSESQTISFDQMKQTMLPAIGIVFLACCGFFALSLKVVRSLVSQKSDAAYIYKVSYQMTNLMMNTFLGAMGLYYYTTMAPPEFLETKVASVEIPQGVYWLSAAQLAYNLWAIPVGAIYVNETTSMLIHHFSVIFVAGMSGFFRVSFEYYTPFMFGILELSSVPLAVVNTFKDNPKYCQQNPLAFLIIRAIFAIMFIYIRWYLCIPVEYDYLRLLGMAALSCNFLPQKIYYSIVWTSSFFLAILQMWWGYLILKGTVKTLGGMVMGGKKEKKVE